MQLHMVGWLPVLKIAVVLSASAVMMVMLAGACSEGSPVPATPATQSTVVSSAANGPLVPRVVAIGPASSLVDQAIQCTAADESHAVWSGDFQAGDFQAYRKEWPKQIKLWWAPAKQETSLTRLTVAAWNLDDGVVTVYEWDHSESGFWAMGSDGRRFFPTTLPLPSRGHWRLVAQAGTNKGCFELDL
jgi:hypothetical protein